MISTSILSADLIDLKKVFKDLNEGNSNYIHMDIMDGNYVPNISFGFDILKQCRNLTTIPFDTHLMIENPQNYIKNFAEAGSDIITFHPETTKHVNKVISLIKSYNVKVGLAINPAESLDILNYTIEDLDLVLIMSVNPGFGGQKFIKSSLRKIRELKKLRDKFNKDCLIEVDGGIKIENAKEIIEAGADIIVAGSAIFNKKDNPIEMIKKFKEM